MWFTTGRTVVQEGLFHTLLRQSVFTGSQKDIYIKGIIGAPVYEQWLRLGSYFSVREQASYTTLQLVVYLSARAEINELDQLHFGRLIHLLDDA